MDHNEIRLVKYTKLIDRAILVGRYQLAIHLAYRCIFEYQLLCLKLVTPQSGQRTKDAFQLSIDFVHYLRKSRSPVAFTKPAKLLSFIRAAYQLTLWSVMLAGKSGQHYDRAMAIYARDQAVDMTQLLIGTLNERQG